VAVLLKPRMHRGLDVDSPGATVAESWIFRLKEGMGDMHWILIDPKRARATAQ